MPSLVVKNVSGSHLQPRVQLLEMKTRSKSEALWRLLEAVDTPSIELMKGRRARRRSRQLQSSETQELPSKITTLGHLMTERSVMNLQLCRLAASRLSVAMHLPLALVLGYLTASPSFSRAHQQTHSPRGALAVLNQVSALVVLTRSPQMVYSTLTRLQSLKKHRTNSLQSLRSAHVGTATIKRHQLRRHP